MSLGENIPRLAEVLEGRSVLVTGGTGSFGRAFAEAVLEHGSPHRVILFSRDEQKHYRLQKELTDRRLRFFVGDIRDRSRLTMAFRDVDIIVHAAAMKHVHLCEHDPMEAVKTNIYGTQNIVEAAIEANVEKVIGLSTDKAVSPVNHYGATKLCMEKLLSAANAYVGLRPTRFSAVRYGNVMGSDGSVIPLFKRQRAQGKLTITDERMTRFWIDMKGAIELVLRGLTAMVGGEVFIPKLPATDIVTLAEAIAPGIEREVIGIRPGEKLHEVLIASEECRRTGDLDDVYVVRPEFLNWPQAKSAWGTLVSSEFQYASDLPQHRLTVAETRDLLQRAGHL